MREHDALEHNPLVSRKALEAVHPELYGWALSRCGFDEAGAADLMQQAYVEILSGRARFDNKSSLKTFLFGIVQNLAYSRFRRMALRLRLINAYAQTGTELADESVELQHSEHALIWKAVRSLPPRQRDITELVFCRDLTIEEASQVMGIAVGTGRVHYDRAKRTLAAELHELQEKESES